LDNFPGAMKVNLVIFCVLCAILNQTFALDFWSLSWSGSDCAGQVTLGVKYLGTCGNNQRNYCADDIPTTTYYNGTICDPTQLFSSTQYPSNNCREGQQFICSDQPPQGLMLYYSNSQYSNCTGKVTKEFWQPKPGVCIFSPQQDTFAVVNCNSTNFPWYYKCNDSSCRDCFDSSPFQVIPVPPGQCSGGLIINNPNICDVATPVGLNDNPTIYDNSNTTFSSFSSKLSLTPAHAIVLLILVLVPVI
jgi:hypothetical protein